jgi:hypothetical protein
VRDRTNAPLRVQRTLSGHCEHAYGAAAEHDLALLSTGAQMA